MTALYWILGVVAYFAIAVGIMRWRTWRINQGKPYRFLAVGEHLNPKQREAAHGWTVSVGLFWPVAFLYVVLVELLIMALVYIWLGIDWTMRKVAGLPPRK